MDSSTLKKKILHYAQVARESRQVASRLKGLLPQRLSMLSDCNSSTKKSHQNRTALSSLEFQNYIREYLEIRHLGHEAKVNYETHLMLLHARQSRRRWNQ